MLLLQEVLIELGTWCRTSTAADFKKASSRVECEGLSFLTITLPAFASDFEKSLDIQRVDPDAFLGFKRKGGLPLFLGGFLDLIFDRGTGLLLNDPSIDAIFSIRQTCRMFQKLAMPCSDARNRKAIDGYIEGEKRIRRNDAVLTESEKIEFVQMSSLLWHDVLKTIDRKIEGVHSFQLSDQYPLPKHGPGTTADGLLGNKKFNQVEWTERLEYIFPMGEYIIPNWRYRKDLDRVTALEPGQERPVEVLLVPKTLKTPRIIAREPTCMQYTQQALLAMITDGIAHSDNMDNFVGFIDQEPNQVLAREGSRDGSLATLDLSEASDSVSNQLVRLMMTRYPHLAEGIDACRSRKADVPGHGVKRLAKFASMGSALTFPVEAMVFATLVFLGIQDGLNRPLTYKDIKSFKGQVRIYGDDIVIPVGFVRPVVARLETFGFLVNSSKSFWTGKFRESCGKEYFAANDVSIVRVRQMLPAQRGCVQEITSSVSLRNQFYMIGMWRTAYWLDNWFENRKIPLPYVLPSSPIYGRVSALGYIAERIHPGLHIPLVRGYVDASVIPKSKLGESGAMVKCFLKQGDEPFEDRRHLERAGRPNSADIKIRMASAI
jgi:hypothetical protein